MTVLHRKLVRDLAANRAMLVTILAIIAVGVASFVGLASSHRILLASQDAYYTNYRMADFWIDLRKAPLSEVEQIADRPDIRDVRGRIVHDVILDIPGKVRPVSGRVQTVPARTFATTLNGLCLVRGTGFTPGRSDEIILADAFAEAHHLKLGDELTMILNQRRESFRIVGTAISPEYVYMVRGAGDVIPDPEHFGVVYLEEQSAREILDFQDACNQIVGRWNDADPGDVYLDQLERRLEPYGVIAATARDQQASHRFLTDEIEGLGVTAKVMPAIFLGVAALILNIVMTRLVTRQQSIIGTLKALGCPNRRIAFHYSAFSGVVGILGGVVGVALGNGLAWLMLAMYRPFYEFPEFVFRAYPDVAIIALAVGFAASLLGAVRGTAQALALMPAQAMRGAPPERGGPVFIERWTRLWHALGFRSQMAIRAVLRNHVRTATAVFASAIATSMIFLTLASYDSFFYLVDFQFDMVAHADLDLGLGEEQSIDALYEVRMLPGVQYAEPIFGLACDLRHGPHERRMGITGLSPEHRLTTPRRADGRTVEIPASGLVLSHKLAELLEADVGDVLTVIPVRGRQDPRTAQVAAVVDTFLGLDCYADIRYLSNLVGEALAINGVQVEVDGDDPVPLYGAIKEMPQAQAVSRRSDARDIIEETLIQTSVAAIGVLVIFAGVIAFGSTLNHALVEVGDRQRELSTLRTMGYTPRQVAGILGRQNLIINAAGTILAIPLGIVLLILVLEAYDSELYRLPLRIRPIVILLTVVVAATFAFVSQVIMYRVVRNLDWLEGSKVKE